MPPPANHKGRVITPRLPDDHSGDDPLPHGSLVENGNRAEDHIWVNGKSLPVTAENMRAAGWEESSGAWFPPRTLEASVALDRT